MALLEACLYNYIIVANNEVLVKLEEIYFSRDNLENLEISRFRPVIIGALVINSEPRSKKRESYKVSY